jgi:hypothetical protein
MAKPHLTLSRTPFGDSIGERSLRDRIAAELDRA